MKPCDSLFDAVSEALSSGKKIDDIEEALWNNFGENSAVLVLDSTGFTRTTQARGIAYFLSVVVQLREIGAKAFESKDALSWQAEADNLYASFATVDQAVSAALAIHEELLRASISLSGEEQLGACVGIGSGRLLRSEHEGLFGNEMNLASKLGEDTAEAGETLLTEAAYGKLIAKDDLMAERRSITLSGVKVPYYLIQTTNNKL